MLKCLPMSHKKDARLITTSPCITRFYRACSLSEILGQLKEGRQKGEAGSLSGSLDLLVDVGNTQTDTQTDTLTVSISAESVKLDSDSKLLTTTFQYDLVGFVKTNMEMA